MGLGNRNDVLGGNLELLVVAAVLRQDDGCDIAGAERLFQLLCLLPDVVCRRQDQDESATVVGFAHGVSCSAAL